MFETTAKVLCKDPASLLAALVTEDTPLSSSEQGIFKADRDWYVVDIVDYYFHLCYI